MVIASAIFIGASATAETVKKKPSGDPLKDPPKEDIPIDHK